MPEIGEVARIVHYIRKHLVGRTIHTCEAFVDDIVYGKVGCSADAFQNHVTGRQVVGADRQGKYFYMTFDKPPHAVMHFGMTGWMKFDVEETYYYKKAKTTNAKEGEKEEWPPKYAKFLLKCKKGSVDGEEREAVEAAFVDPRRLARIRLVDCEAEDIRKETPLKENGPDPVRDKDIVTVDWLSQLLNRKKVPVKALLLNQSNLSGIGNWVADEILYQARLHPEQYSNTFSSAQIKSLHQALMDVCTLAVETNADSSQFPETWLMKYRWDKGKKEGNVLPSGERIVHLTVGGRTSAIVPSLQRKTGAVAGDVGEDGEVEGGGSKAVKARKRKGKAAEVDGDEDEEDEEKPVVKKGRGGRKGKAELASESEEEVTKPAATTNRGRKKACAHGVKAEVEEVQASGGAEDEGDEVEARAKPSRAKKAAPRRAAPKQVIKPDSPAGSRRSGRTKAE